jgi:hypothetical protein
VRIVIHNKELPIDVTKENIRKLIFLAKLIERCPRAYRIEDNGIKFSYKTINISFSDIKEALNSIDSLHSYSQICRFGLEVHALDETLLLKAPDNTR